LPERRVTVENDAAAPYRFAIEQYRLITLAERLSSTRRR